MVLARKFFYSIINLYLPLFLSAATINKTICADVAELPPVVTGLNYSLTYNFSIQAVTFVDEVEIKRNSSSIVQFSFTGKPWYNRIKIPACMVFKFHITRECSNIIHIYACMATYATWRFTQVL